MEALYPFFEWCDKTAIGQAIRDSRFLFPIIESIHLLALTVLLGTIVVVNLRLLGLVLTRLTPKALAHSLGPLTLWSLITMIATGSLLFVSEALKCYENPPFRYKMALLMSAIVFQWTVARMVMRSSRGSGRLRSGVTALLSLALWFGTGMAGRAIGFY